MANEYATLAEVKAEIDTDESTDDTFISSLLEPASRRIDEICKRHFYGETETRYFHAVEDVTDRELFVDEDLQSITTLTNGDGDVLASNTYVLMPPNESPKYSVKLKSSSGKSWTWQTDPENAISIAGVWGYVSNSTPPTTIKRACIRLVRYWYSKRDAAFETVGLPETGQMIIPTAIPKDVDDMLKTFKRPEIRAI